MTSRKKILRIGGHEVEACYSPDDMDGYKYSVIVFPFSEDKLYQQFHLMCLTRVAPKELPDSCHMIFQNPKSEFKKVNFVDIKSNERHYELEITLCFDYRDWEMKESLPSFIDRYSDAIKKSITLTTTSTKTEYGFFVHCKFTMSGVEAIYEFYSEKENELERTYRNILATDRIKVVSHKYGEGKFHWWVRYVFVPLAGSGAIATVLAKYLFR